MATFTISTSVSPNGSGIIDPTVNVESGTNVSILYRGYPGYNLSKLIIDGNDIGVADYPNEFVFLDVESNHSIMAVYSESYYDCIDNEKDECLVCNELLSDSADLVINGVTDTICASLQNDTGLNPSLHHTDGYDLGMMNDCLIGRQIDEMEDLELCDWKSFISSLVSNLYNMIKAMICAVCGLWAHVHTLTDQSEQAWNYIDRMREDISNVSAEKEVEIPASDWSDTTVSVDSNPYYYATVQMSAIYTDHPIIALGSAGTIPSAVEILDFAEINAAVADLANSSITFYALTAPTGDLVVIVKGAE